MYLQVKNIKSHIGSCLRIADKNKTQWIHSVYLKGYSIENDKTYLLFEIVGYNDTLYGCELKIEQSKIIDYLYYDDGRDLDYYGEYSDCIMESVHKSDILDENYEQWCNQMESKLCC